MTEVAVKQIRTAGESYVPSIRREGLFLRELQNSVGLHNYLVGAGNNKRLLMVPK